MEADDFIDKLKAMYSYYEDQATKARIEYRKQADAYVPPTWWQLISGKRSDVCFLRSSLGRHLHEICGRNSDLRDIAQFIILECDMNVRKRDTVAIRELLDKLEEAYESKDEHEYFTKNGGRCFRWKS